MDGEDPINRDLKEQWLDDTAAVLPLIGAGLLFLAGVYVLGSLILNSPKTPRRP